MGVSLVGAASPDGLGLMEVPAARSDGGDCPKESLRGIGTICRHPDGMMEVFDTAGRSLGFSHGPDPVPSEVDAGVELAAAREPACVTDPDEGFYARVVYPRPIDAPHLRDPEDVRHLVRLANGFVHERAAILGAERDLRVLCTPDGEIDVLTVALPTPLEHSSFSSIATDLRALGSLYNTDDPRIHYWVYLDYRVCACGGMGHISRDSSGDVNNRNNGGALHFSMTFGYYSHQTMLHELSHNMGAVGYGSPNSSGAGHCNDGRDTMCYSDGGSRSAYRSTVCSTRQYDCNADDYFNPDPPEGSYLDVFWNLGDVYHRFMRGCGEDTGLVLPRIETNGTLVADRLVQVPESCQGRDFIVEGWRTEVHRGGSSIRPYVELDICWYAADTLLGCHATAEYREEGLVPLGADSARVVSTLGSPAEVFLRMG